MIHIIVIVGFLVYFNMLFNGFVADDGTQILTNSTIHSISNIPILLFQTNSSVSSGGGILTGWYYRPLMLIFFSFLYTFFGNIAFFFHSFQLLLHIVNTLLLFSLFLSFFSKRISLFLSLIFLVHPINQETVAYISSLQDVLFLFFGLLALFYYQRSEGKHTSWKKIILISLLIFLSLMSKVTGVLFILLLFFRLLLFDRKQFLNYLIAVSIAVGIYLFFKQAAQYVSFAIEPSSISRAAADIRFINIPKVIFYYLGIFFSPKTLITHQDWLVTSITPVEFYIPLLVDVGFFACIAFLGLYSYRMSKKTFSTFLFFSFWFLIGSLLLMQIIPLDFTVADRWFYFPVIGLLGLIGICIERIKIKQKILIMLSLIILLILSVRTIVRNENWRTGYSLYTHDIVLEKDNVYLNGLLGNEYLSMGKYDEALKYFNKAASLNPSEERNWINIGATYYSKGNLKLAEKNFKKAVEVGGLEMGYEKLGQLYVNEGRLDEARIVYEEGVGRYPQSQRPQLYLAYCEYYLHNRQNALEIATKAYQLSPNSEALYVLKQITNNQEIKIQQ